ncbi:MAG: hypothetical protein ACOYLF_02205 [Blastocatellia bacterium]
MNIQENGADLSLSRRLNRNMLVFLGLMLAAGLWKGSMRLVAGVALGGGLAVFNRSWLEGSIRSLLARIVEGQDGPPPTWPAAKLILRYLVVAFCFGIALWTGLFHPLGMAIGFASFAGGVMIEAGYQIYLAFKLYGSE